MSITFNWANRSNNTTANLVTTFNVGATNAATTNGTFTSGDLLLAVVMAEHQTLDPGSITLTGFTQIDQSLIQTGDLPDTRVAVFWKIAGGSESGSYAASWTNTASAASWLLIDIQGATVTPIDAHGINNNTAYSTNMVANSISPTGAADLLVGVWGAHGGKGPFAKPASMTLIADVGSTSSDRSELIAGYEQLAASGATGTRTATTTTVTQSVAALIALTPAAASVNLWNPWPLWAPILAQ